MRLLFNTERWQWIKVCWDSKNNKPRAISLLLNGLPQMLFVFGGEEAYNALKVKYGAETWWAPHNLWRTLFHFIGGFLLAVPFFWCKWIAVLLIFSLALLKELFLDRAEQTNLTVKNFMDAGAWGLGALSFALLV